MNEKEEKQEKRQIRIDTKITHKDLYEFLMFHNYISMRGFFSVVFSFVCAVGTIWYWTESYLLQKILMMVMECMFTVMTPVEYYFRACRQEKRSFSERIQYIFDERGITIQIGEQSSFAEWDGVMKVLSTRNLVLIYFTPVRSYLLAKRDMDSVFEALRELMQEKTQCYRFRMEK